MSEQERTAEATGNTMPRAASTGPHRVIRDLEVQCAGRGVTIAVECEHITLGREAGFAEGAQHIDLSADDTVSRRHAKITIGAEWAYVVDLDSTNGTSLNGVPLSPFIEMIIRDGDVIRLGENTGILCRA